MRIGIFGGYGTGNFGNDASFEALRDFLRAEMPEAEISAICSKPEPTEARFQVKAVGIAAPRPQGIWRKLDTLMLRQPSTWRNWARTLKLLNQYDVILSGGTGVFDDFRDTPLGWPSVLLRWCLAARIKGVEWRFISVGAGPIVNPIGREMMKFAGSLARQRLYRDEDSYQFMKRLGVDGPTDGVVPDLAFLLSPADAARPADAPLVVGVGMMTYHGWHSSAGVYDAYIALHVRLIEWLQARGYGVRMIIGQTPADVGAARDVDARLKQKVLTPCEADATSIHDAMAIIGETDLVIASRYHVQIAALKMGRPLIALSYGPKSDALMADVGLDEFCQDLDNVNFDLLTQQVEKMIAGRERYATQVRERVAAMKAKLIAALKRLDFRA
ncbi:MAG: polysaccharide pyruvyl transferase family protein [Hyphomonadaceae bacterium]|nr:polysaccharide pyruvyl transferase family protein [Hyphomonadaceae bacterium]